MSPRLLAALAATLLGAAGCAVEVPFELTWDLSVRAPRGSFADELTANLTEQASLWERRDSIEAIQVQTIQVRVAGVGASNRAAELIMALGIRTEETDPVAVEELALLDGVTIRLETAGDVVVEAAPSRLEALVMAALAASGQMTLLAHAQSEESVDAALELTMTGVAVVAP